MRVGLGDGPAQKKVAIVEDERDLLDLYSAYFWEVGYGSVFAAETGEELIRAVTEGRVSPEVIVMDYRLPGLDGIETAKRLRKIIPGLKVIVTTADDTVERLAEAEGYGFLRKPFSLSALAGMIAGD